MIEDFSLPPHNLIKLPLINCKVRSCEKKDPCLIAFIKLNISLDTSVDFSLLLICIIAQA